MQQPLLTTTALRAGRQRLRNVALFCGILSSLLYVAINLIVPPQWPEYNATDQTVSELSAVGAPTRNLWLLLATPYTFLALAFAWGVWDAAWGNRRLRIVGGLLLAYAFLGFLWPFAPMHQRAALAAGGATFSDTLHISLGVATELIYLAALWVAATAFGKGFRIYSIATFFVLLFFGALTFRAAPGIAANSPTPYIGVWERINISVFLLWVIVLASLLLMRRGGQPSAGRNVTPEAPAP
ncbi:hypothetical protein GCM10028786_25860 [Flaviaesturariibacter terrae]